MECQSFEKKITKIYHKINSIELIDANSEEVGKLFDEFRQICKAPNAMEVTSLSKPVQEMRFKLLEKWGVYEGLLEKRYVNLMLACAIPLDNLNLYPHNIYLIRMAEEYKLTMKYSAIVPPRNVAFLGSGALPISSIILARDHLTTTRIDNFDFDPCANDLAAKLTAGLSNPMGFYTKNVIDLTSQDIAHYDVIFLGALVGVDKVEKLQIIAHLAKIMAYGSVLMVRGAYGTKSFMYPPVAPEDLCGFEVQDIWHPKPGSGPTNSVIVAKKVNHNNS